MSFVIVNSQAEVAALPDGTLITWLPVMDDPSSEAVAFVRKATVGQRHPTADVWIAPGNGWEPEPLSVIVFPARIVLLGVPQPGDYVPTDYLTSTDEDDLADPVQWATLSSGGTYPRDVALQCAATFWSGPVQADDAQVLKTATSFAEWLTHDAQAHAINALVNQGVVSQPDGVAATISADAINQGRIDPAQAGYFAGGLNNG